MYVHFTDRARKIMQLANQVAQCYNHEYIGTEHILLGLVKEGSGVGATVLRNCDIDLRKIRREVEKIVQSGPFILTLGQRPQTPRAKKIIEHAIEEARNFNHNYVGSEHLLLGLLREEEAVAAQVLMTLGLRLEHAREEVLNLLGRNFAPQTKKKSEEEKPQTEQRTAKAGRLEERKQMEARLQQMILQVDQDHRSESLEGRLADLESHLWKIRFILGSLLGTVAGFFLAGPNGAVAGFPVGGLLAGVGKTLGGAIGGAVAGLLIGESFWPLVEGGNIIGLIVGALIGGFIGDIGQRGKNKLAKGIGYKSTKIGPS